MKSNKVKRAIYEVREWIICIAIALLVTLLVSKFLMYKIEVPTGSMIPTINEHDQLFVTRIYNLQKLKTGDIIVFYSRENKDTYIKRLIGLPGDTVKIDNGIVSVNGKKLNEKYVKNQYKNYTRTFEVPKGKYFFLGDNRANSNDSRWWINPYVDKKDIKAKALIKVYPFNDIKLMN